MGKAIAVPKWAVIAVVVLMLSAVLGYVVYEYGFAALPEFVFVAFGVIVIALIVMFFGL